MFEALGFSLDDDHIDFSFTDTATWPRVSADAGMPPSLFISLGDPVCGPDIQLVTFPPPPSLMWIDSHYHACDQFRVILNGDFQVDRERLTPGRFGYQNSGVPYREGFPGVSSDELWMFMVHGERRGARSTMLRANGDFAISAFGEDQLDRPVPSPDDAYWQSVPGGARGRIGMSTTLGEPIDGFVWGSFEDDKGWRELQPGVAISAALMSDRAAGPVVFTVRCAAGKTAVPRTTCSAEVAMAVIQGACRVGTQEYRAGDVRVQKADSAFESVVAGAEGCSVVLVISDRRASLRVPAQDAAGTAWPRTAAALVTELADAL